MRAIGDIITVAAACVEEQPCRRPADEGRDSDSQQNAAGHQNKGEGVDLHGAIVGLGPGAEVGPKVTSTLGRRRFLAAAGLLLASACAPEAARPASQFVALPALGADPKNGVWPAQYLRAPAPVREAYSWAIGHEPTLRYIPCYCVCGA